MKYKVPTLDKSGKPSVFGALCISQLLGAGNSTSVNDNASGAAGFYSSATPA